LTSLAKSVGPLDGRGNLPLYQELQRALRKAIDSRILGPDDALPSERDLAADFAVSRITVRKALDGLVADGLLVRRQGSGNFVSARVDKNFAMLTSFSEDMRARGRTPQQRGGWSRAAGTVTPEEALALRMSPGTPVFPVCSHSLRRRCADGAGVRHHRGIRRCHRSTPWMPRCMKPWKQSGVNVRCAHCSACRAVLFDRGSGRVVESAKSGNAGAARRNVWARCVTERAIEFLAILLSRRYV